MIILRITSVAVLLYVPLLVQSQNTKVPPVLDELITQATKGTSYVSGARTYQIAQIDFRGYSKKEVIIGIDDDGDKKADSFYGLQTVNDYEFQETFEAEVIYLQEMIIVKSTEDDDKVYWMNLGDYYEAADLLALIPRAYTNPTRQFFGYGIRYHKGDYTFEYFVE